MEAPLRSGEAHFRHKVTTEGESHAMSKPKAPPRASREAPKVPSSLAELEEAVRERLHANGQHGAVELFAKYTAAVNEALEASALAAAKTARAKKKSEESDEG